MLKASRQLAEDAPRNVLANKGMKRNIIGIRRFRVALSQHFQCLFETAIFVRLDILKILEI
jgi:hypothetical protein